MTIDVTGAIGGGPGGASDSLAAHIKTMDANGQDRARRHGSDGSVPSPRQSRGD
ncbi:hypothetical protein [Nocardia stercoris]|uniref:hypothetical protein n=1 Tax=Nocardia stercoris TaxID=2483361 RepID=UPI00131A287B|nr:hypothetical protein [Nocardia stercoris]